MRLHLNIRFRFTYVSFEQTPDGTVKLEHYKLLLQHDLNPKTGLRAVPKLTEKHVAPNNFQKMSVKLAAQVYYFQYSFFLYWKMDFQITKIIEILNF